MEWQLGILFFFGTLILLMFSGMPVAFTFLCVNIGGLFLFWGGLDAMARLVFTIYKSIGIFTLLPVPLFILMGSVLDRSGVGASAIGALDKLLGRLPGRLSLVTVFGGTLLGALTGVSMGAVALMGKIMLPPMYERNYKEAMSLGPILGCGALALMIPPSVLAVVLGALAQIPVGRILIAIIVPGLMLAAVFALYILIRCRLQPELAPYYEPVPIPLRSKLWAVVRDVLPLGVIIFLVTGVIIVGIATPSEAAATGCLGTFIVAACYRKLNWGVVKGALVETTEMTVMIFLIICAAVAFSQNLAYSGVSRGLLTVVAGLPFSPVVVVAIMAVAILILGMFMEAMAMMMITIPVFMPVMRTLGVDPVWWAVVMLLAIVVGPVSPPFGLDMFVLKGLVPPHVTMEDIYRAAFPFLLCELVCLTLIIAFPKLVVWLPGFL